MIEIWIAGRKLCETEKDNGAVIKLEAMIKKAGYSVIYKFENGKTIMMV